MYSVRYSVRRRVSSAETRSTRTVHGEYMEPTRGPWNPSRPLPVPARPVPRTRLRVACSVPVSLYHRCTACVPRTTYHVPRTTLSPSASSTQRRRMGGKQWVASLMWTMLLPTNVLSLPLPCPLPPHLCPPSHTVRLTVTDTDTDTHRHRHTHTQTQTRTPASPQPLHYTITFILMNASTTPYNHYYTILPAITSRAMQ